MGRAVTGNKRGKKPLPAAEKRSHTISSRLNVEELRALDELRGSMQRGEWLREAALGAPPVPTPPKVNAEVWASLGHGLSNLNQIARHLNSGRSIDHQALEAEIVSIRNKLLGLSS